VSGGKKTAGINRDLAVCWQTWFAVNKVPCGVELSCVMVNSAESPAGKKRKRYGMNSTYRLEVVGDLDTNKRAHAVAWASTYYPVSIEISDVSRRDFKRMLQIVYEVSQT
jgi:hypothetical protein